MLTEYDLFKKDVERVSLSSQSYFEKALSHHSYDRFGNLISNVKHSKRLYRGASVSHVSQKNLNLLYLSI
jgi:hypothetical protein